MTYCDYAMPIIGIVMGGFAGLTFAFYLRAKAARLMGFAEGYYESNREWDRLVDMKNELDAKDG